MRSIVVLAALLALASAPWSQAGLRTRKSKEAIVKANTSKAIAEAVGQRIDNFCALFEGFYDDLGLEKRSDNKLVARLFNTYEEYETQFLRANPGDDPPLAYFSPSLNAIVLYNDEADLTLRQTLFHEASHQYLNRYTSDAPKWLNEGLAEYFEGWRMAADGTLVEKRVNLFDLKLLQDCIAAEKMLPPRALIGYDAKAFDDFRKDHPDRHPYLHYVTAWSLVWFSLELSDDPRDRERLLTYLRDLNDKGARAEFQVEDMDDLEARWKAAITGLQAVPVDAVDHVLLASGYSQSRDHAEAARLYAKALEIQPDIPGAAFGLGFCQKRMGDYDAALATFERAREADPTNPSIPYWMARIVLGIDKKNAASDPARALELAEAASRLADESSPQMLELVARCQAAAGDPRAAVKTVKRILKLELEDDEVKRYEALEQELKGK